MSSNAYHNKELNKAKEAMLHQFRKIQQISRFSSLKCLYLQIYVISFNFQDLFHIF